jgi:hypothetical protein
VSLDLIDNAVRANPEEYVVLVFDLEEYSIVHRNAEFPQTAHSPQLVHSQSWMTWIPGQEP